MKFGDVNTRAGNAVKPQLLQFQQQRHLAESENTEQFGSPAETRESLLTPEDAPVLDSVPDNDINI